MEKQSLNNQKYYTIKIVFKYLNKALESLTYVFKQGRSYIEQIIHFSNKFIKIIIIILKNSELSVINLNNVSNTNNDKSVLII